MTDLPPIEGARLTTTPHFRAQRRLLAWARALAAASLTFWSSAFLFDMVLQLGYGALLFSLACLTGLAGVFTFAMSTLPSSEQRFTRTVRIEGTRATVLTRAGIPTSQVVSLHDPVSRWAVPGGVELLMKDGSLHEVVVADPRALAESEIGASMERRAVIVPLESENRFRLGALAILYGMMLFGMVAVFLAGLKDVRLGLDAVKWIVMQLLLGGSLAMLFGFNRSTKRMENGQIVVGLDGVLIRRNGIARFIPMAEIIDAEAVESTVTLRRQGPLGGEPEIIRVAIAKAGSLADVRAEAVESAIRQAIERRKDSPRAAGEALDRGHKTLKGWREDLTRAAKLDPGYRTAPLGPEELGAVVLDASAPPDRRVGAALSLAAARRDEARAVVRIATPTLADLDLKASLEAAAEGEIDERSLRRSMRLHGRSR